MNRTPPPFSQPADAAPISPRATHLPAFRRYPALNVIRTILLILAYLVGIFSLVLIGINCYGLFLSVADFGPQLSAWYSQFVFIGVVLIVGGTLVCSLIAMRELIAVIIDIQENTLAAARR